MCINLDCPLQWLALGYEGENMARPQVFDFSSWAEEFGAGVLQLLLQRPGEEEPYPVALSIEGTEATWTPSATDTAIPGQGQGQLIYRVGETVAKNAIFRVLIGPSLGSAGDPPEPYESWLEQLQALAAETEQSAIDAAGSADAAAESATAAGQSAEEAAESAVTAAEAQAGGETAQAAAETARTQAEAAQSAAIAARTGAEAAQAAAEAAQGEAEGAQDAAEGARDAAQAAAAQAQEDAGTAQNAAQAAETEAGAAAQSAAAAANSAASASGSATAAGNAATAASGSATSANEAKVAAQAAAEAAEAAAAALDDLDAGDVAYDDEETYPADTVGAEISTVKSALSSKQDAPSAAGTAGQVLGLDSNLDPAWITPSGGGGDVTDVQVNGTSVVSSGVANVPKASDTNFGVVEASGYYGIEVRTGPPNVGMLQTVVPTGAQLKAGANNFRPITPSTQHQATFFGLAKAAGDTTQKNSSNAVGVYTEDAKSAISSMLDAPETVSGTTPTIAAKSGVRYVCGECATLTVTLPASGIVDVVFKSGSTATVLTVTPPTGATLSWANGFDPTSLDASTTYEINIMAMSATEFLGVCGSWT